MRADKVRYSKHLELRLTIRAIPRAIPRAVFRTARRHFVDVRTGLSIAVRRRVLYGKRREIAVAYRRDNGNVL